MPPSFFWTIGVKRGVGEQRLEDLILVGIDGALHHVLAQAPGGVDQHDLRSKPVSVSMVNIDAGAGEVGAHHLLHADRQRDLQVVEALGLPVADGAVGEERGETAAAGVEQGRVAPDIEEGLLLAGEACLRQVLGGGA